MHSLLMKKGHFLFKLTVAQVAQGERAEKRFHIKFLTFQSIPTVVKEVGWQT
jgi:hypothetical protein